jgi:hypothetical protein
MPEQRPATPGSSVPNKTVRKREIVHNDLTELDRISSTLQVIVWKAWKAKRENVMQNGDWTVMPQLFREWLQLKESALHMQVAKLAFLAGLHTMARISSETALFMLEDCALAAK